MQLLDLKDFEARSLSNKKRTHVPMTPELYAIVKKHRQPMEHYWQTLQRIVVAGINAEMTKEN